VAKLDEHGTKARTVRDLVSEADRKGRAYDRVLITYKNTLFDLLDMEK
jgi:hypothetical protein